MIPVNERKVCDCVGRVLEERSGIARTHERCPEKDQVGPRIDYMFRLGNQTFAIEHTIIEPFPSHLRMGVDFRAFIEPIERALATAMPRPGTYHLDFPIDPSSGLSRRGWPPVQSDVIDWVRCAALQLHEEQTTRESRDRRPHGHQGTRTISIADIPLVLRRTVHWAQSGRHDGRLFISRYAPDQVEDLRLSRLSIALEKKCPKLQQCKADGAISVLVLETFDFVLSNHFLVGDALAEAMETRTDHPDEIFLVDTAHEAEWTIWSVIRSGVFWPDEEQPVRYREFNPAQLREV